MPLELAHEPQNHGSESFGFDLPEDCHLAGVKAYLDLANGRAGVTDTVWTPPRSLRCRLGRLSHRPNEQGPKARFAVP